MQSGERFGVTAGSIFDYERWARRLPALSQEFRTAAPYPHVVLEDFLSRRAAEACLKDFPGLASDDWIHYTHINEKKFGQSKLSSFSPSIQHVIAELNSPRFCSFLGELTGIDGLLGDDSLMGGGLHQSTRGGYLNVHADFSGHPHRPRWRRRINVLVYLNPNWEESYGGQLELWDRKMERCVRRVLPVFNRAVIFRTNEDSFHGHPEPMSCPESETRKSLALYYFTEESMAFKPRSTNYRARPADRSRAILIKLDGLALRGYDAVKRALHLNDDTAGRVLRLLGRRKGSRS